MQAWLSTSATTALRNPTSSGAAGQPLIANPAFQQSTPCGYTTMNPLWSETAFIFDQERASALVLWAPWIVITSGTAVVPV